MKDERLDKMNQEYHEIFIPAELRQRVETGIREAKKDMETERQTTIERKKKPMKKKNNKHYFLNFLFYFIYCIKYILEMKIRNRKYKYQ